VIESENLPARAERVGDYLIRNLKKMQTRHGEFLKEVRGLGLFVGMEFVSDQVGDLLYELFLEHGVLVASILATPHIIRLEPPLIIDEQVVDDFLQRFEAALRQLPKRLGAAG
jgi:putrescine aminotransferase